ncbi:MAG: sigma-54-dependent Fis family transcriptional regulator [Holophagae bacterium]|nr:sigma-54-dependent Fis family transcriptional regulator [Holophagae bacterium]
MIRILVIDDDRAILNFMKVFLLQTGQFEVEILQDSTRAFEILSRDQHDILLLDMDMPEVSGMDVLRFLKNESIDIFTAVLTGVEDIDLAIAAMKLGISDYLLKPVDEEKLLSVLKAGSEFQVRAKRETRGEEAFSLAGLKYPEAFQDILTCDREMLHIFHHVEKFAETDNSVLIWGESGSGKELIARAIHVISKRRDNNFIAVNAGAFADDLFTSEFFGHDRGSFTGAVQDKKGFLEEANGGTLFLDEIGELSLPIQVKLLRVLQEEEFYRLGSTRNVKMNVRIIAATNKNLFDEIHRGNFRKDLFFRLNINAIHLPALRERREDIQFLAEHFLKEYTEQYGKSIERISTPVMKLMRNYSFPGNVRELMNLINSAIVVESGKELRKTSLPCYFLEQSRSQPDSLVNGQRLMSLQEVEKEHIRKVLEHTSHNKTLSAKILGISRVSLISRVKKYELEK